MTRVELINKLINDRGYTKYLEIGVHAGATFDKILCKIKRGVEPHVTPQPEVEKLTSDEFFIRNWTYPTQFFAQRVEAFDIVFVDGFHQWEQTLRDIQNALLILNQGGIIVVHDCNPTLWEHQVRESILPAWTGDVWKAIAIVRAMYPFVRVNTVDTDWGCGLIDYCDTPQTTITGGQEDLLSWKYFTEHKTEILNLISVEEFHRLYLKTP